MGTRTIHAFPAGGMAGANDRALCFYQCGYVRERAELWGEVRSYPMAVERADGFKGYRELIAYALDHRAWDVPPELFLPVPTALGYNALYSCELYRGPAPAAAPNHEIVLATNGDGSALVVFDPGLGFFAANADGLPGASTNREVLERELAALHAAAGEVVGSFGYLKRRMLG